MLLAGGDETPDALAWLPELVGDFGEPLDPTLPETPELTDCPVLLGPLVDDGELPGEVLGLALLATLGGCDDVPLLADDGAGELVALEGTPELGREDCCELPFDSNDDSALDKPELDAMSLRDDGALDGDGWLEMANDARESDDPDFADDAPENSLEPDDALRPEDVWEMLDWLSKDADLLDGLPDESGELDADGEDPELPDETDRLLSDDGGAETVDEGGEDACDEPLLFESEEVDWELPDGDDRLSEPLEREDRLSEPLDRDDERSDDPDELRAELLRSELLGQLDDDGLDKSPLDGKLPLDLELGELPSELLGEELPCELDPLLPDESLEELGEERDDSLTLENDLLDPCMTNEELIRWLPDRRCE